MKLLMMTSAVAVIALSQAAFAQNTTHGSQPAPSPSAQSQPTKPPAANPSQNPSSPNLAAAQQIQQDLKKAGFTDVKVVAESFVVQAKTKDGNPVVMTIGPHGMSAFEAMQDAPGSNAGTTGSAGPSRSGSL